MRLWSGRSGGGGDPCGVEHSGVVGDDPLEVVCGEGQEFIEADITIIEWIAKETIKSNHKIGYKEWLFRDHAPD